VFREIRLVCVRRRIIHNNSRELEHFHRPYWGYHPLINLGSSIGHCA
jgi:hypothetical protein